MNNVCMWESIKAFACKISTNAAPCFTAAYAPSLTNAGITLPESLQVWMGGKNEVRNATHCRHPLVLTVCGNFRVCGNLSEKFSNRKWKVKNKWSKRSVPTVLQLQYHHMDVFPLLCVPHRVKEQHWRWVD